jgi:acyl-CoA thioesterase I
MLALLFAIFVYPSFADNTATAGNAVVIVALGDSLTDGYGLDKQQAYPQLLQNKFAHDGLTQVKVLNGGISGSTSAGAEKRLAWFLKAKPQILFLALGANDGLRGVDPANTRDNLIKTIQLAKQNKMHVILAGMMLPPNYGARYTAKFRTMFSEIAKTEKIDLMPFLLEGVAGEQKLNQEDGIHPNAQGHLVMADNIYKYVKPAVQKFLKEKSENGNSG